MKFNILWRIWPEVIGSSLLYYQIYLQNMQALYLVPFKLHYSLVSSLQPFMDVTYSFFSFLCHHILCSINPYSRLILSHICSLKPFQQLSMKILFNICKYILAIRPYVLILSCYPEVDDIERPFFYPFNKQQMVS